MLTQVDRAALAAYCQAYGRWVEAEKALSETPTLLKTPLREHYRDELDTGHVVANAKVAESLFRKATGDGRQSVTAAIFWLKTRAGWKETSVHELGGAGVGPVVVQFVRDDSEL